MALVSVSSQANPCLPPACSASPHRHTRNDTSFPASVWDTGQSPVALETGRCTEIRGNVTSELFRAPTSDELELALLQIELESRRSELERLEGERDTLEVGLTRFAADVKARVGDVKDEIRNVRHELEEMRQRISRLRADPMATPADVERDVAEEMAQAEAELNGEFIHGSDSNGKDRRNLPTRPMSSIETEAEVLRLYRELAKRHHPDLARSSAERERRAELMLRVNVAYRDRDLATLQSIYLEVQLDSPLSAEELCRQRLAWTRHEIARLAREIRAVELRIESLVKTDTYTLWQEHMRGEAALDELETRTRQRLVRERERLDEATAQYDRLAVRRQVMQRRAASRSYDAAQASGGSD